MGEYTEYEITLNCKVVSDNPEVQKDFETMFCSFMQQNAQLFAKIVVPEFLRVHEEIDAEDTISIDFNGRKRESSTKEDVMSTEEIERMMS